MSDTEKKTAAAEETAKASPAKNANDIKDVKEENTEKKTEKKPEKLDDKGLTAKGKENEAIEAAMEAEDEDDAGDLILEDARVSIDMTPENAVFRRSPSGLVSLTLTQADGKVEEFERVVAIRCFPVTNPDEFVSIREPDSKKKGRGKEIGMIRRMSDMPKETQDLLNEELERRYFTPEILKISSMKEKFGYSYWDVETTAGKVTFVLNNPFHNIRVLEDESVFINDIDGNCFKIPDITKLDAQSVRKIEIYL
ncbi:MAG: DUF1854 domain-containing protein [Clostridia bacterium]|nr:DUF1854 domain-containing protein [Clostridia bacterium]MBQ8577128.1 DUF1854 domain-containing protein [Clostridia bacterium]